MHSWVLDVILIVAGLFLLVYSAVVQRRGGRVRGGRAVVTSAALMCTRTGGIVLFVIGVGALFLR